MAQSGANEKRVAKNSMSENCNTQVNPTVTYQGAIFTVSLIPKGDRVRVALLLSGCHIDSPHHSDFTRYGVWYNPFNRQICDYLVFLRVYPGAEQSAINQMLLWSKMNGAVINNQL